MKIFKLLYNFVLNFKKEKNIFFTDIYHSNNNRNNFINNIKHNNIGLKIKTPLDLNEKK